MKPRIKNRRQLLAAGDASMREVVLDVIEETLVELNGYKRLKSLIFFDGRILRIGTEVWDLSKKRNVYLICGGKAANATTMALEEILGERLSGGVAIVKNLEPQDHFKKCEVFVGGHPLPNIEGYKGCQRILQMVAEASPDDLFISAISGGTSALMACPIEGLSLEEEILTSDICLKSGANIHEINSIRRHISQINGGQLAKKIEDRGAEMILLMHMDGIGWPATADAGIRNKIVGGPMAPDNTTLQDAHRVIANYGLKDKLPRNVVRFFEQATEVDETPKELKGLTTFSINTIPDLCLAARVAAERRGIPVVVLTSSLAGSSRHAGTFLASIAREVRLSGNPARAPIMFIATGAVSTIIEDPRSVRGLGGPGQELAASFAIGAQNVAKACLASIDSEGTDGPTDAAGGIVDSTTFQRAQNEGVDLYEALRNHATYDALGEIGCRIYTGNTGTTLCDLHILYLP
jgi:glycerate 2-kinase